MVKDTINAVRQAELYASQMEKDALLKKDKIVSEAREEAKEIISNTTKEALAAAKEKFAGAEMKRTQILEEARQRVNKETAILEEKVKDIEQEAIKQVIRSIVKL